MLDFAANEKPGDTRDNFLRWLTALDAELEKGHIHRALNLKDLQAAHDQSQPTIVQTVEGAFFIEGHLDRIQEVYKRGLRHLQLLHDRDDMLSPLGDTKTGRAHLGGLTAFGADVVKKCNRLGIVVDLAHASHETVLGRRRTAQLAALHTVSFTSTATEIEAHQFLAIVGLGVRIDLLVEGARKCDGEALTLSLWLLVPLPIVYYGHLPIKYLLPCMPAVILCCFRLGVPLPVRVARTGIVLMVVAGLGYSLLILRSDAEFANFGRAALDRLIRPHVAAGETVWYGGHFSSYWYAPKAGASLSVVGGLQPKRGDLFAVGLFEGAAALRRIPNRTLVESVSHTYSLGRTMGGGMGLYTNRTGVWLWGFGKSDWDRYELWRIN